MSYGKSCCVKAETLRLAMAKSFATLPRGLRISKGDTRCGLGQRRYQCM